MMKSNKSPASDGFTSEFFKGFWKYLGNFVTRFAYDNDILSVTQRHGIITLLPKGDKPRQFLKKMAANHFIKYGIQNSLWLHCKQLELYLGKIIHPYQTGFISNRYNVYRRKHSLIYDILQYTEDEEIPSPLSLILKRLLTL